MSKLFQEVGIWHAIAHWAWVVLPKLGVCEERWVAYPVGNQLSGFLSTSEMARNEHSGNKRAGNLFVLESKSLPQCSSLTPT
jgi:hypothetical protein